MLYALAAYGQSDMARQKEAIKMVAEIYNDYEPGKAPDDRDENNDAAQYLLLNQIAYNEALYLSDRIWIDAEGHRTPPWAVSRVKAPRPRRSMREVI